MSPAGGVLGRLLGRAAGGADRGLAGVAGLSTADLARRAPPADWEAFLLIGVLPAPNAPGGLRWLKVHCFSGGRPEGGVCLSAVEDLDGGGERLVLLGRGDGVARHVEPLPAGALHVGAAGWDVRAPGLTWGGEFPHLLLESTAPALRVRTRSRDAFFWLGLGRALSYFTAFGPLELEGPDGTVSGLGLVEHAWGAQTRVPFRPLVPARWHWDVLAFDPEHGCAGLGVAVAGRWVGLRSGGCVPGGGFATGGGLRVEVREWSEAEGRAVPARWDGTLALGGGRLRYQARATTPVAPVVAGGGFLGFAFEGEWRSASGARRMLDGTGFCEYRAEGHHG